MQLHKPRALSADRHFVQPLEKSAAVKNIYTILSGFLTENGAKAAVWSSGTAEPAPRPPEGVSPGSREAPRRQALALREARRQRKGIKPRGRP